MSLPSSSWAQRAVVDPAVLQGIELPARFRAVARFVFAVLVVSPVLLLVVP